MNKKRGIAAERELLHLLWHKGYAVARIAGSGSIPKPSCDLVAGNKKEKLAIEVKTTRSNKKYINEKQLKEFISFAEKFGLKPVIAIKFFRKGWFMVEPKKLKKVGKEYLIRIEDGKKIF